MAIYLNFNKLGIKGNVTAKGYEDWIDVSSMQFGVGRGVSMEVGNTSNREATRPSISEVTISKALDASSGSLFKESVVGVDGVTIIIDIVKTGAAEVEKYCRVTLEDCLVSSYSLGASSGGAPNESLAFSFTKILTDMTGADRNNKNGSNMLVGYDLNDAAPL